TAGLLHWHSGAERLLDASYRIVRSGSLAESLGLVSFSVVSSNQVHWQSFNFTVPILVHH
ncbi:MAG: hypothetical protein AAF497_18310, partial [Planctomycetota bacterium]